MFNKKNIAGRSILTRVTATLLIGTLVACSGGGGGGSDGGGGSAGFTLSNNSVSFSATQGGTRPATQNVFVNVTGGTVFVGTTQAGSGFSHTFLITGQTTGRIDITPDQPTTAGTFTGTIAVHGCADQFCQGGEVPGSPKTINVTYTVGAAPTLSAAPASVNFESNIGATPASQNVSLSISSGTQAWSASVVNVTGTSGWLNVTPSAGTLTAGTPQTLTFSVSSPPTIAETRSVNVVISAASTTKTIPVTFVINDAAVNFVSPYVLPTGAGGNVIVRGHGFSALNSGSATVQFGALAPTTATVVSDTEIRVAAPTAAGSYTITVSDGTKIMSGRTGLKLLVVSPTAFPAATIARLFTPPGPVGNLIYDAERRSLYVMDGDANRIERYRFNTVTGGWAADAVVAGAAGAINPRIALSPDGTELDKTSGGPMLHRVNPATLGLLSPGSVSPVSVLGTGASLNLIGFANDGRAIGNTQAPATGITLYRYDMLTQQFAALSNQVDMTSRTIAASGDGSLLVLPTFESLAPGFEKPVFTYDASTGTLTQRAVTTSGTENVSVSRDGSRIILVSFPNSASQTTTVYDGSFTALGTLPAGLAGFVISPDGSTAYAYFPSSGLIRKFNLNSPNGTGGFTEVGGGVAITSPGTFFSSMAITPDGGTVFLAGRQNVIVQPAP